MSSKYDADFEEEKKNNERKKEEAKKREEALLKMEKAKNIVIKKHSL